MKKLTILKALVLSLMIAMCSVMPLHAQTDGFFKSDSGYEDRQTGITGGSTNGIDNQQFGTPLGSGLLIMVAAGAGYAIARRKRNRKEAARNASTLLLALAMILTFTQCKKKIVQTAPDNQGVYITLTLENDAKHNVITFGDEGDIGKVEWADGDFIFVISAGHPVGALQYSTAYGNRFVGYIGADAEYSDGSNPVETLPLYFIFTGGVVPDMVNYKIDISNQENKLAVLSCGASYEPYSNNNSTYTSFLENKCALVKFTLNEDAGTNEAVRVGGMLTQAQLYVNPTTGAVDILPISGTTGPIVLNKPSKSPNTERWAVLLQQAKVDVANVMSGNTIYREAEVKIPALYNNALKEATIDLTKATSTETGHFFSLGNGKLVTIAPSNLKYGDFNESSKITGTTYELFDHQYDFIGGTQIYNTVTLQSAPAAFGTVYFGNDALLKYNNEDIDESTSYLIDLFGWGTGNNPGTHDMSITSYPGFRDWGNYTIIGHTETTWYIIQEAGYYRTPKCWELVNIFGKEATIYGTGERIQPLSIRSGKSGPATIDLYYYFLTDPTIHVYGLVTLPDDFTFPTGLSLSSGVTGSWTNYAQNQYSAAEWAQMETNGAVFLPAAGMRSYYESGKCYYQCYMNHELHGEWKYDLETWYWTSDPDYEDDFTKAHCFSNWVLDEYSTIMRSEKNRGFPVRLVHNVDF